MVTPVPVKVNYALRSLTKAGDQPLDYEPDPYEKTWVVSVAGTRF